MKKAKQIWNYSIAFIITFLNVLSLVPNILYNMIIWIIFRHDLDEYFDNVIEIICFGNDSFLDDKFPFFKIEE